MWKSKRNVYFQSITGHFFDDYFHYKSAVLSFKKFIGQHLEKRIKLFINNELNKLGLKDKVIATTSDNANDIKAGTRGFGTWFSCFCHNLNLILHTIIRFNERYFSNHLI